MENGKCRAVNIIGMLRAFFTFFFLSRKCVFNIYRFDQFQDNNLIKKKQIKRQIKSKQKGSTDRANGKRYAIMKGNIYEKWEMKRKS